MLREPTQHVVSGWIDGKHDCRESKNPSEYQRCVSNCQTYMIVGGFCSEYFNQLVTPPPSIVRLDAEKILELALEIEAVWLLWYYR
eukprot:4853345-Amphidinium_carterae.1